MARCSYAVVIKSAEWLKADCLCSLVSVGDEIMREQKARKPPVLHIEYMAMDSVAVRVLTDGTALSHRN